MNDSGDNGDDVAGDGYWTVQLRDLSKNRHLIRYKIRIVDGLDKAITVPYADDPQPNFAYYCYNGVPDWKSTRPGSTPVVNYSSETLTRCQYII